MLEHFEKLLFQLDDLQIMDSWKNGYVSPQVAVSNISIFTPPWGNAPIWRAHIFQMGGSTTQPPTRLG